MKVKCVNVLSWL